MLRFAVYHGKTEDYSLHLMWNGGFRPYIVKRDTNNVWLIVKDNKKYNVKGLLMKIIHTGKSLISVPYSVYANPCSSESKAIIKRAYKCPIMIIIHGPVLSNYYSSIVPSSSVWNE